MTSTDLDLPSGEDVAAVNWGFNLAEQMESESQFWTTIVGDTFDVKFSVLQAFGEAYPLNEHLSEELHLHNISAQTVKIHTDDDEWIDAVQIMLMCKEGNFTSVATGILTSVQQILGLIGQPSLWPDDGLKVTAVQSKTRKGLQLITLRVRK